MNDIIRLIESVHDKVSNVQFTMKLDLNERHTLKEDFADFFTIKKLDGDYSYKSTNKKKQDLCIQDIFPPQIDFTSIDVRLVLEPNQVKSLKEDIRENYPDVFFLDHVKGSVYHLLYITPSPWSAPESTKKEELCIHDIFGKDIDIRTMNIDRLIQLKPNQVKSLKQDILENYPGLFFLEKVEGKYNDMYHITNNIPMNEVRVHKLDECHDIYTFKKKNLMINDIINNRDIDYKHEDGVYLNLQPEQIKSLEEDINANYPDQFSLGAFDYNIYCLVYTPKPKKTEPLLEFITAEEARALNTKEQLNYSTLSFIQDQIKNSALHRTYVVIDLQDRPFGLEDEGFLISKHYKVKHSENKRIRIKWNFF
jgi:ribosomal protein S17E